MARFQRFGWGKTLGLVWVALFLFSPSLWAVSHIGRTAVVHLWDMGPGKKVAIFKNWVP